MSSVKTSVLFCFVFTMMLTLSLRSFCQALTEINRGACPTLTPLYRALTTTITPPTRCGHPDEVVTVPQLKSMMARMKVQLFDVREPSEYQAGTIPGAVNLPLGDLELSLKLPSETFEQRFGVNAPGKEDDNIVFSCRSGVRSGQALGIARLLGFSKARHLEGGYKAWEEAKGSK